MKIVHLVCIAPPEIGGMGSAAAREVELLNERGHAAVIVSLTTHAGFRLGNGGSIHALDHLVCEADAVHLHYPFYGTAEKAARLRRAGLIKRLIVTLHMDATASGLAGAWFDLHRRFWQPRILDAADTLIISSSDYARNSSFRDVASKVIELPFGVDENRFRPATDEERLARRVRFGLPSNAPCALFVGGMDRPHAFKGVDVLLRALAETPGLRLTLVGDGALRPDYERLASELGVKERCRFLGALQADDLVAMYQAADFLILPSTSQAEAFGLVAIEAQACGIPAIVSDLPGVRTVIEDGVTGRLVTPRDVSFLTQALRELSADAEFCRRLGKAARRRVEEKYTWHQHGEKLIEIYRCASPS